MITANSCVCGVSCETISLISNYTELDTLLSDKKTSRNPNSYKRITRDDEFRSEGTAKYEAATARGDGLDRNGLPKTTACMHALPNTKRNGSTPVSVVDDSAPVKKACDGVRRSRRGMLK